MRKLKNRLGEININHQGLKMKIIQYNSEADILVEFEDNTQIKSKYQHFKKGNIRNPNYKIKNNRNESYYNSRIGKSSFNNQGCKMTIIKYIDSNHIVVEFEDKFHTQKETNWKAFKKGSIKNPNLPTVCGVGITGNLIPTSINNKKTKEYETWIGMLKRCFNSSTNNRNRTYKNCTVCTEWLYYPNFYKWIISQSNYEKWKNNIGWHIDKDIIIKGNKEYSPTTCCLVPHYINTIFKSTKLRRGKLPIGVTINKNGQFFAQCGNPFTGLNDHLGTFDTVDEAFKAYKNHKEKLIKQLAQKEYELKNISKKCYLAMINYTVEITD